MLTIEKPASQDAVNYKNGAKNQWRRQAWNAIAEHVQNRGEAIVLYLPGSTDLDRPLALRRGFKPANLIAIERNKKVAKQLRPTGVTTICGTLNQVLESWPKATPIGVVVADFQCGMNAEVMDFLRICNDHPAMSECCVLVNLQRGRDPMHADVAQSIAPDPKRFFVPGFYDSMIAPDACEYERKVMTDAIEEIKSESVSLFASRKNRAAMAVQCMRASMTNQTKEAFVAMVSVLEFSLKELQAKQGAELVRMEASKSRAELDASDRRLAGIRRDIDRVLLMIKNERLRGFLSTPLPSYRSTDRSPYFDSAVVSWFCLSATRLQKWAPESRPLAAKIGAALAIRTMRLRGDLGGGRR